MDYLPNEILAKVLGDTDVRSSLLVCHRWKNVIKKNRSKMLGVPRDSISFIFESNRTGHRFRVQVETKGTVKEKTVSFNDMHSIFASIWMFHPKEVIICVNSVDQLNNVTTLCESFWWSRIQKVKYLGQYWSKADMSPLLKQMNNLKSYKSEGMDSVPLTQLLPFMNSISSLKLTKAMGTTQDIDEPTVAQIIHKSKLAPKGLKCLNLPSTQCPSHLLIRILKNANFATSVDIIFGSVDGTRQDIVQWMIQSNVTNVVENAEPSYKTKFTFRNREINLTIRDFPDEDRTLQ